MSSPTSRTLAILRKQGLRAQVVEYFIPARGKMKFPRRRDLFNFIDLIYLNHGHTETDNPDGTIRHTIRLNAIVGVQVCAGASHAARRQKILTTCKEAATAWLMCGGRVELRSWSKRKVKLKNGKKADRWTERIQEVTLADFEPVTYQGVELVLDK